jgi:hypothetical protein
MRSTAVRERVQRRTEVTRFHQQFGPFDTDREG